MVENPLCVCMHNLKRHNIGCRECGCIMFREWDKPVMDERLDNMWSAKLITLARYYGPRYFFYPVRTCDEVLESELIELRDVLCKYFGAPREHEVIMVEESKVVKLVKDVKYCPWCGKTDIAQTIDWNKFICKRCKTFYWV